MLTHCAVRRRDSGAQQGLRLPWMESIGRREFTVKIRSSGQAEGDGPRLANAEVSHDVHDVPVHQRGSGSAGGDAGHEGTDDAQPEDRVLFDLSGDVVGVEGPKRDGRVAPGRFPSPAPLYPGCPGLFFQTGATERDLRAAVSLVADEQVGLLLTARSGFTDYIGWFRGVINNYRDEIGASPHLLVDANQYAGQNRRSAKSQGANLDPSWVTTQRELGLSTLLTDSPYVRAGEHAALVRLLCEARDLGPDTVAVLPLHLDWLRRDVAALIEAINAAETPVALVLEHTGDPLGIHSAVAGLARLLAEATSKVALMRSDLSVIGAVAFGATFGAVGATTSLRHLYPKKDESSRFNPKPGIGALVPCSLAYRKLDKIFTAEAGNEANQERWKCECRVCYGRPLSRIVDEVEAYRHSIASIARLGEHVLGGASPLIRQHAWLGRCRDAQMVNFDIAAETGLSWESPGFLGAWNKLAGSLSPLPD